MNSDIIAAVLHLREASRLLETVHPELSYTLLRLVGAFVQTDDEIRQVEEAEAVASRISSDMDENGSLG